MPALIPRRSAAAAFGLPGRRPVNGFRMRQGSLRGSGFSLIEVVLALAVVSFCGVTMLGLLSAGLSSFQHSEELSAGASIRNQIVQDLQQAGWAANLYQYFGIDSSAANTTSTWVNNGSPKSQTQYFDGEANLLPSSDGAVFKAMVTPVVPGTPNEQYSSGWTGPAPVAGAGPAASASLMEFQIVISRSGVPATGKGSTVTYTICLGRN